jgi:hypothetical protein
MVFILALCAHCAVLGRFGVCTFGVCTKLCLFLNTIHVTHTLKKYLMRSLTTYSTRYIY